MNEGNIKEIKELIYDEYARVKTGLWPQDLRTTKMVSDYCTFLENLMKDTDKIWKSGDDNGRY
jgi:hypothetical protein